MKRKDWDSIAQQEFESMDQDTQAQWDDLRQRVNRRVHTPYIHSDI